MLGRVNRSAINDAISRMEINWKVKIELKLKNGETVIKMTVGEDDGMRLQLELEELFTDKITLICRVNNQCGFCGWVSHEIAVSFERTKSKSDNF